MTNEQKLYIHTDYIWHLNHPITPPPELVMQCLEDSPEDGEFGISKHIATQAARWGADQELEACCEWFQEFYKTESWVKHDLKHFRDARRPKPPSLKEQDYGPLGEKQQMTEIEEIKAQLNVLEKKLSFLEELEKTKSPAEEAYRRWWGEYPSDDNGWEIDNTRWRGFRVGYNYAQKDYKVGEYQEPHAIRETVKEKWDVVRESVKWCEEHPDEDPLDYVKPQTPIPQMELLKDGRVFCVDYNNTTYYRQEYHDSNGWIKWWRENDEGGILTRVDDAETFRLLEKVFSADLAANPDGSLKFTFGPKLYDVILDWWDDIFSVNSNDDSDTSVRDLVTRIEEWLPKPQSANSQNTYVELTVEGFNDAINKIKSKLR